MTGHLSKPSLTLVNYITGLTDGLLVPLFPCGLVYLYFGKDAAIVLLLFFIIFCIGAFIYGLARYWGEQNEIRHNHPDIAGSELQKDAHKLRQIGISENVVSEMIVQVEKEQNNWLAEIQQNEMDWHNLDYSRARKSGIQTGFGFFAGACLMALPFSILFIQSHYKFICFAVIESGLMFSFGWLKGNYIHKNPLSLAMKQMLLCVAIIALLTIGSMLLHSQ
jgi:VIT1/CCC1 family predicted Fe2+/Mn2+ transporter